MISLNNKLLLKPYKGEKKVKANISGGFASIAQKSTLIGLELVADFQYVTPTHIERIEKGSTVYFQEELLYASNWSKTEFDCESIEERFIIADIGSVICIGTKRGESARFLAMQEMVEESDG